MFPLGFDGGMFSLFSLTALARVSRINILELEWDHFISNSRVKNENSTKPGWDREGVPGGF